VKTTEGKNIIRLHNMGYPLASSQKDLTLIQRVFLIMGANQENEDQKKAMDKSKQSKGSTSQADVDYVTQKARERRGQ
jgi:hypothetical protein